MAIDVAETRPEAAEQDDGPIAISKINIKNLLSFGPDGIGKDGKGLKLEPLNIVIGLNGSGKSNFLDALGVLQSTPFDLVATFRATGGVSDWLWKQTNREQGTPTASIEAEVFNPTGYGDSEYLRYLLVFTSESYRLAITDERIENYKFSFNNKPFFYYGHENGRTMVGKQVEEGDNRRKLEYVEVNSQQSILSQFREPNRQPELAYIRQVFGESIGIYRDVAFGRKAAIRSPQPPDWSADQLQEDGINIGAVLSDLSSDQKFNDYVQEFYSYAQDVRVRVSGGQVETTLIERDRRQFSLYRVSDGTMRWLYLLALLLKPPPAPALICIDEPELGLHPDIIPTLANLLREASKKSQLIITTHSDGLLSQFTNEPESVVVCQKEDGATQMRRLVKNELEPWLSKYRLGGVRSMGHIDGAARY